MAWDIKGQMVETCSCNMLCLCWFGVKDLMVMDQCYISESLTVEPHNVI